MGDIESIPCVSVLQNERVKFKHIRMIEKVLKKILGKEIKKTKWSFFLCIFRANPK